jgi:hypothetical protein
MLVAAISVARPVVRFLSKEEETDPLVVKTALAIIRRLEYAETLAGRE